MAEKKRCAGLNYGFPGTLSYYPSRVVKNRPGSVATTRILVDVPRFELIGPTIEIYPASKLPGPDVFSSSSLYHTRRQQENWLLQSHPEAFIGNKTFHPFLGENLSQFKSNAESSSLQRNLLAIGEIADMSDTSNTKRIPVIAVAAGESGESVRIAKLSDSQWAWDEYKDVALRIPVVDPVNQDEELIWAQDGLPITQLKFATGLSTQGQVNWLLLQKHNSTSILQPEYYPTPSTWNKAESVLTDQQPSLIKPTLLFHLNSEDTGGNAHMDVVFCQGSATDEHEPWIGIVDDCGFWSTWLVGGTQRITHQTTRLTRDSCGHIDGGPMLDIDQQQHSHTPRKYGLTVVESRIEPTTLDSDPTDTDYPLSDISPSTKTVLLVWNSSKLEAFDPSSGSMLSKSKSVWIGSDSNQILDIQNSPNNAQEIFILTSKGILQARTVLHADFTCTLDIVSSSLHHNIDFQDARMTLTLASSSSSSISTTTKVTLLSIFSLATQQLHSYWFHEKSDSLPSRFHRHVSSIPALADFSTTTTTNLSQICIQPVTFESNRRRTNPGPGSLYQQHGVQFYNISLLGKDLQLKQYLCASSSHPDISSIEPPLNRLGWTLTAQQKHWKRKRKYFFKHIAQSFVLPDEIDDKALVSLFPLERPLNNAISLPPVMMMESNRARPVKLNLVRVADFMRTSLVSLAAAARGEALGVPVELFDAIRLAIQDGLTYGSLGMMSWARIVAKLPLPLTYEYSVDAVEKAIETLLGEIQPPALIPQLRRTGENESPGSIVSVENLQQHFAELWIDPLEGKLPAPMQAIRRVWTAKLARDVLLSSYGVMVVGNGDKREESVGTTPSRWRNTIPSSPNGPSSSQVTMEIDKNDQPDAAIERLRLLAAGMGSNITSQKQCSLLDLWPTQLGVDVAGYVSSVAAASDERFRGARERLQKKEARRKSYAERYTRLPPSLRTPRADGGESQGTPIRPAPIQIMSSQQAPNSSQSHMMGLPTVTMSQPVSGMFGDRKNKKQKRKSGFR